MQKQSERLYPPFSCSPEVLEQAAAALAVGVGSFCDPVDVQGLSHYLEHMLFMGSEKYPDENEYDSFLARHGGSSNAFTEMVSSPRQHSSVGQTVKGTEYAI